MALLMEGETTWTTHWFPSDGGVFAVSEYVRVSETVATSEGRAVFCGGHDHRMQLVSSRNARLNVVRVLVAASGSFWSIVRTKPSVTRYLVAEGLVFSWSLFFPDAADCELTR
jgi:hypothetical protein